MGVLAAELHFTEGPAALPDGGVTLVEIRCRVVTRVAADGTVSVVGRRAPGLKLAHERQLTRF